MEREASIRREIHWIASTVTKIKSLLSMEFGQIFSIVQVTENEVQKDKIPMANTTQIKKPECVIIFYWTALWMNELMIIIHKRLLTPRKIETLSRPLSENRVEQITYDTHVIQRLFSEWSKIVRQGHTKRAKSDWCVCVYVNGNMQSNP